MTVQPDSVRTSDTSVEPRDSSASNASTLAWVGPFLVFVVWLALDKYLPIANPAKELIRDGVLLAAIIGFARRLVPTTAPYWMPSVGLGLAVFVVWIAPDALIPGWRSSSLFQNGVTGRITTSIPPAELTPLMLALRTARASLLVPIIEELFWRGWLPRWLQDSRFSRVPLGRYTAFAFWTTAILFAVEHGPFWDVGLACGIIYNWWMRRTRSLGDLVLVHAVTNFALSVYIISTGRWMFWM